MPLRQPFQPLLTMACAMVLAGCAAYPAAPTRAAAVQASPALVWDTQQGGDARARAQARLTAGRRLQDLVAAHDTSEVKHIVYTLYEGVVDNDHLRSTKTVNADDGNMLDGLQLSHLKHSATYLLTARALDENNSPLSDEVTSTLATAFNNDVTITLMPITLSGVAFDGHGTVGVQVNDGSYGITGLVAASTYALTPSNPAQAISHATAMAWGTTNIHNYVFVADSDHHVIWQGQMDGSYGTIVAGTFDDAGDDATHLTNPTGLLYDTNDWQNPLLWFVDGTTGKLYNVTLADHQIHEVLSGLGQPSGLAMVYHNDEVPYEDFYYGDAASHRIMCFSGVLNPPFAVAGSGADGDADDPSGTSATFHQPASLTLAANNRLYVTDQQHPTVREIDLSDGNHPVVTVAGSVADFGATDSATGTGASFLANGGLTSDGNSNVYLVQGNHQAGGVIRKIVTSGTYPVTTLAGGASVGNTNAYGTAATFYNLGLLAYDSTSHLLLVYDDALPGPGSLIRQVL